MNENSKLKRNQSTFLRSGMVLRDLEEVAYVPELNHRPLDNGEKENLRERVLGISEKLMGQIA